MRIPVSVPGAWAWGQVQEGVWEFAPVCVLLPLLRVAHERWRTRAGGGLVFWPGALLGVLTGGIDFCSDVHRT